MQVFEKKNDLNSKYGYKTREYYIRKTKQCHHGMDLIGVDHYYSMVVVLDELENVVV